MKISEKLKDSKIEQTFADALGIDLETLEPLMQKAKMPLGDYMELTVILDNEGKEIDRSALEDFIFSNQKYASFFGKYFKKVQEGNMKRNSLAAKMAADRKAFGKAGTQEKSKKDRNKTNRQKQKQELKKIDMNESAIKASFTKKLMNMDDGSLNLFESVAALSYNDLKNLAARQNGFQFPGIREEQMSRAELRESVFKFMLDENMTPMDLKKRTQDLEQAANRMGQDVAIDVDGEAAMGELDSVATNPQDPNSKVAIVKNKQGGETMIADINNVSLVQEDGEELLDTVNDFDQKFMHDPRYKSAANEWMNAVEQALDEVEVDPYDDEADGAYLDDLDSWELQQLAELGDRLEAKLGIKEIDETADEGEDDEIDRIMQIANHGM